MVGSKEALGGVTGGLQPEGTSETPPPGAMVASADEPAAGEVEPNWAAPGPKVGPGWAWPAGGTAGTTNGEPPLGVACGGGPYPLGIDSWACG